MPIFKGAAGGEEDDQGGELRLLLGDDGEAHPQPAFQVKSVTLNKAFRIPNHSVQALWTT